MCTMLEASGVAGKPNSFFRPKSLENWMTRWGVSGPFDIMDPDFNAAYFAAMRTEGRGGTPVFGLRLMGPDLTFACAWLDQRHPNLPNDLARLEAAFGPLRFIHLARKDKLAEAVSYLRAEQTGLWHRNADGSVLEQIAPTEADGFDAAVITDRMRMLQGYDADWQDWFAREGISPLRLTYEAFARDPQAGLALVLAHIGQDPALAKGVTPGLSKLADATSTDWIARYRALFPGS